jgi:hypothetical protein
VGEDGGAEEVGEALEAGLGGGGREQGFFLLGEPDIDLRDSRRGIRRLRRLAQIPWVLL